MKTGFETDSTPVFEPGRRKMHAALAGIAPSLKVKGGYVRTRLPLMLDGMIHLETNSSVSRICPYPVQIEYASGEGTEMFKFRDHVFDLGVELRSGRRVYIDYEPYAIQMERPWMKERTARLKEVTQQELGADYYLHDERDLYIQPRFANIKAMYQHLRVKDHEALMEVRKIIAKVNRPITIGMVRAQVRLKGLRFEVAELDASTILYSRELSEVDRTFTALMQMVAAGEIEIDLGHPFCDASLLFGPEEEEVD